MMNKLDHNSDRKSKHGHAKKHNHYILDKQTKEKPINLNELDKKDSNPLVDNLELERDELSVEKKQLPSKHKDSHKHHHRHGHTHKHNFCKTSCPTVTTGSTGTTESTESTGTSESTESTESTESKGDTGATEPSAISIN
jgi:hypothetical protein